MGDIINFSDRQDDLVQYRTVFNFAILSDALFCANPVCPYCEAPEQSELIETVENGKHENLSILGDLMQCTECDSPYLVVERPILPSDKPIMTTWSVPERIFIRK